LGEIAFPAGEPGVFEVMDDCGERRRIPLHRIREVTRDGQVIWRRPDRHTGPGSGRGAAPGE
jgi:hypothetical protein